MRRREGGMEGVRVKVIAAIICTKTLYYSFSF